MAMSPSTALDAIVAVLNQPGRWTPETLEAIADIVTEAGYTISDTEPDE